MNIDINRILRAQFICPCQWFYKCDNGTLIAFIYDSGMLTIRKSPYQTDDLNDALNGNLIDEIELSYDSNDHFMYDADLKLVLIHHDYTSAGFWTRVKYYYFFPFILRAEKKRWEKSLRLARKFIQFIEESSNEIQNKEESDSD